MFLGNRNAVLGEAATKPVRMMHVQPSHGRHNSGNANVSKESCVEAVGSTRGNSTRDVFKSNATIEVLDMKVMPRPGMEDAPCTDRLWLHGESRAALVRNTLAMSVAAADAAQDLHTLLSDTGRTLEHLHHKSSALHLFCVRTHDPELGVQKLKKDLDDAQNQSMALLDLCLQNATISERLCKVLRQQSMEMCCSRRNATTQREVFFCVPRLGGRTQGTKRGYRPQV